MIKFRGKVKKDNIYFSGKIVEGCAWYRGNSKRKPVVQHEVEGRGVFCSDIYPDTLQINISGHWLTISDLEAIVEKVMVGKGDS